MITRSVFVVAANTKDVAEEREFAEDAKPDIRRLLDTCDGVVNNEVHPTDKGVIAIHFETHMHGNANNAYNVLVNGLVKMGYEVLAAEPRARINTGDRKKASKPEKRLPPTTAVIEVRHVVVFSGTPTEVRRIIAYVRTLTGVTLEDPPD